MLTPKVFISATSADLRSVRSVVKEALLKINCHPVEQTNFEPDWRTVENMLRDKISECDAMVHIVGMRYGAEPDPSTLPAGAARRSYTQMEYDLGCELREKRQKTAFRIYTFICPEDFPYDAILEAETDEKARLQQAHRRSLLQDSYVYEQPKQNVDIQSSILALQEQVLLLKQREQDVRKEVRKSHQTMWFAVGLILLLIAGGIGAYKHMNQGFESLNQIQKLDAIRVKNSFRESSERKLVEDLAAAEKHTGPIEEREKLREAAQLAHEQRLLRIDDVTTSLMMLEQQGESSLEMREMIRVLQDSGVEKALEYIESKREKLLQQAKEIKATHAKLALEQARRQLSVLLEQAKIQLATDRTAEAQKNYKALLDIDEHWQEALIGLCRVYSLETRHISTSILTKGLPAIIKESETAVQHADLILARSPDQPGAAKLLSAEAMRWASSALLATDREVERVEAHQYLKASLGLASDYLKENPDSESGAESFIDSSIFLGNYLIKRNHLGDKEAAETVLLNTVSIANKLLNTNPKSIDWITGLASIHNELSRLHSNTTERSEAGQALEHIAKSYELTQIADKQNSSLRTKRNLVKVGSQYASLLIKTQQVGSVEKALNLYEESVRINEQIYKDSRHDPTEAANLSKALTDLAKAKKRKGLYQESIHLFQQSLEIIKTAWESHPDSTTVAYAYANTLLNYATQLIEDTASIEEAEQTLTECAKVINTIKKINPDSISSDNLLIILHYRCAELLHQRNKEGDLNLGLDHLKESLYIQNKLSSRRAINNENELGYASNFVRYGDLLLKRNQKGDSEMAMEAFIKALNIHKRLVSLEPNSRRFSLELCTSLARLGDAYLKRNLPGDAETAWDYYIEYNELAKAVDRETPDSAYTMRNLWASYAKLGHFCATFKPDNELQWYHKTYETLECMKQKEMHFTKQDEEFHTWVKERIAFLEKSAADK